MTRILAVALIAVILVSSYGCTTCRAIKFHAAHTVQEVEFHSDKKYEITFVNGQRYEIKGEDLSTRGDLIGIRFPNQKDYRYYRRDQIRHICVREFSRGKTVFFAVVGGSVALAAIVAGIVIGFTAAAQE